MGDHRLDWILILGIETFLSMNFTNKRWGENSAALTGVDLDEAMDRVIAGPGEDA
jgi:hypothetical protein